MENSDIFKKLQLAGYIVIEMSCTLYYVQEGRNYNKQKNNTD